MGLVAIEAALLARLETLLTTAAPPGFVEAVARVAGDVESQAKLEQQNMTGANAVFLARHWSRPTRQSVDTLVGGSSRLALSTRWRVRILVRDLRDQSTAISSPNNSPLALFEAVLARLDGYECPGIAINTRVKYVADEPDKHRPGRYIAALYFDTLSYLDAADSEDVGESPLTINADINLESGSDAEPNPVTQVKVIP